MKGSTIKVGLGMAAAGGALLLAHAWFLGKYFFQVKRFSIGKPESDKRVRIVLLTDLHFKKRLWPFHFRLLRKINELNPQLVLISGDIIDEFGRPGPARRFFGKLKPAIPVVAIPGNHDNKNEVTKGTLRQVVGQNGGRLLIDETVQMEISNTTFTITGLNDSVDGESCFYKAVKDVGREEHHLLLVHSPAQQVKVMESVQRLNEQRTDDRQLQFQYIFSGHTHGGQIRLANLVPFLPRGSAGYVNGWYNRERPFLYISKGFGTSAIPFRFGARPEMTVFEYGV